MKIHPNNKIPNDFEKAVRNIRLYGFEHVVLGGDPEMKNFGHYVRALRIAKGYTQESLAVRAEVDRTRLSCLELGKGNMRIDVLKKISIYLGSDLAGIFKNWMISY